MKEKYIAKLISKVYNGEVRISAYDTEHEFSCVALVNNELFQFTYQCYTNKPQDNWIEEEAITRYKNGIKYNNELNKVKEIKNRLDNGGFINKEEHELLNAYRWKL